MTDGRISVRERRKALNLTQAELADRIGKPQSYISKLENGELEKPAFDDVVNLARALGVDDVLRLHLGQDPEAVAS